MIFLAEARAYEREIMYDVQKIVPSVPSSEAFTAQYYELTLRVRFQRGKWRVSMLGPFGLMVNSEAEHLSQPEAVEAAIGLAQKNLHQEKGDVRPPLDTVEWSSN